MNDLKMTFIEPLCIHEQGLRENNEDAFLYKKINENTFCYIVCDGVGGSQKGEVASALTCKLIINYMTNNVLEEPFGQYVDMMIKYVHDEFETYQRENLDSEDMGTTLALLVFHGDKVIFVHIGDSRVYHIRGNEILFQTQDHSLVNELLKNKIITLEEALHHPQKNIIMRAIQAGNKPPAKADIHFSDDISEGDYFFLCSDGILEKLNHSHLLDILNSKNDDDEKIKQIKEFCEENSRDNFTALLIPIQNLKN